MKIFGIGRNYAAHIKELNNERPDEPVIFTKPETALLTHNRPFYYPGFSSDIHFEVEILLKICKVGKNIDEKFAHTYYDKIGVGIDWIMLSSELNDDWEKFSLFGFEIEDILCFK